MMFGSLFAGIGGLDLGLERAGMTCAWQVEIDKSCRRILERHWPAVPRFADVRKFHATESLPRPDVICGGFPCQDVSMAGQRAGLGGQRSGLWWEFHRLIGEFAPTWVLIENVPGLLSSAGGRDMAAIVDALAELGYWWSYRVLDAQWFGVPQRRRRVFIVGHRGNVKCAAEVLFERESLPWNSPPHRRTQTKGSTCSHTGAASCGTTAMLIGNVAHTLRANGADASEDGSGRVVPLVLGFQTRIARNGRGQPKEIADALTSSEGGSHADSKPHIAMPTGVRRLTPLECERLQGLPDDWTRISAEGREMSDSARYRMIGNAVAVPVAEWIGRRILAAARQESAK